MHHHHHHPCNLASCVRACRYVALQRDQRFEAIYANYLDMHDAVGLMSPDTPYMHYASTAQPSQYGSWGLQEYTGQPAEEVRAAGHAAAAVGRSVGMHVRARTARHGTWLDVCACCRFQWQWGWHC